MKKHLKEWTIDAPWGKIALISWGDPEGEPVLMVHGRQDSAATFIPILEYLPEKYYYVALDSPGNGKSDPFPKGVMLTRFLYTFSVDVTVTHLGWQQFIFMGHSLGCEQGLFYNAIYPNRIKKFIFFDPNVSLQRLQVNNPQEYFKNFYEEYYKNYWEYNHDDRLLSKKRAIESVMRARGLTEELAEIVLSRSMKKVGDDQYRLSWDRRLKSLAPQNYPIEYYYQLFSTIPPTLVITATNSSGFEKGKEPVKWLLERLKSTGKLVEEIIESSHDVHLIKTVVVAEKVTSFLENSSNNRLSSHL